ncbi:DUF1176 domain-containing protein [Yokenella regensburgei]|uniref:DUF1176 domain-containing protein n=1 Tax=Yokenella regensburgei TaxID=158877 RepID=UPI003F183AF1
MNNSYKAAVLMMATLSAPVLADDSGTAFNHKDWEVVCDNTLTCRAAGYSQEEEVAGGSVGSVLLTRKAGADTPVTVDVVLAEMEADETVQQPKLTLWVDGTDRGEVEAQDSDTWHLSDAQTSALIAAVKGSGKVEFRGGAKPFILSGDGATAVLLKMDDVQGRVGTPGALSKKGDKPESGVTAPVPAPVIQAAKVSEAPERTLTEAEVAALKPKLIATLNKDSGCDRLETPDENAEEGDNDITLTPLNESHVLISALCWRAAYNEGYGFWVTDSKMQGTPVLVTDSASDYSDGLISLGQRGRGIGDCWSSAEWVWDGKAFVQSSRSTTGMCRYIRAGGTWDLPSFVAEVKTPE